MSFRNSQLDGFFNRKRVEPREVEEIKLQPKNIEEMSKQEVAAELQQLQRQNAFDKDTVRRFRKLQITLQRLEFAELLGDIPRAFSQENPIADPKNISQSSNEGSLFRKGMALAGVGLAAYTTGGVSLLPTLFGAYSGYKVAETAELMKDCCSRKAKL